MRYSLTSQAISQVSCLLSQCVGHLLLVIITLLVIANNSYANDTDSGSGNMSYWHDREVTTEFAAQVPADQTRLLDSSYWYGDEDIRSIIQSRLGDSAYIAPAVPNVPELIKDVATTAVTEAKSGKSALIPVNLSGNHWAALVIRTKSDGSMVAIYNDSFGNPIGSAGSESSQYIAAIKTIAPDAEVIDLQVKQQTDGSSCGPYAVENLIMLAKIPQSSLVIEKATGALKAITRDVPKLRENHARDLNRNN